MFEKILGMGELFETTADTVTTLGLIYYVLTFIDLDLAWTQPENPFQWDWNSTLRILSSDKWITRNYVSGKRVSSFLLSDDSSETV